MCGSIRGSNRNQDTDRQEAIGRIWNKYAKPPALDAERISHGEIFFTPLERFYLRQLDRLPPLLPRSALDIGCGFARNLIYLLNGGKVEVGVGIDISQGALDGARRLAASYLTADHELRLVQLSLEEFAKDHGQPFGLVMATQVLGYAHSLDDVFADIRRCTTVGSRVVISDAQAEPKTWLGTLRRGRLAQEKSPLRNHRDPQVMFRSAETVMGRAIGNGFAVERVAYGRHFVPYWADDVQSWLWSRRFTHPMARTAARGAYGLSARLCGVEDEMLTSRSRGNVYWVVLTRVT